MIDVALNAERSAAVLDTAFRSVVRGATIGISYCNTNTTESIIAVCFSIVSETVVHTAGPVKMRGTDVGGRSNQFSHGSIQGPSEWKGLCLVCQPMCGGRGGFRADVVEGGESGTNDG